MTGRVGEAKHTSAHPAAALNKPLSCLDDILGRRSVAGELHRAPDGGAALPVGDPRGSGARRGPALELNQSVQYTIGGGRGTATPCVGRSAAGNGRAEFCVGEARELKTMTAREFKILGISGSLRADSYNTLLLRAAQRLAPDGMRIELYGNLADVPAYNEDDDTDSPPAAVADLRRRIAEADGLLIATPEYNYGIPGVLKNALDWASTTARPPLAAKAVAVTGAAPTNFGSVRAQLSLRQMFLWTDSRVVVKPEVIVFRAHERFDDRGELVDLETGSLLEQLLAALRQTIEHGRAARGRRGINADMFNGQ